MRITAKTGLWIILAFTVANLGVFAILDRIAPAGRRLAKIRGEDPVNYFGVAHSLLFDHDFNLNNEYEHMPPDGRSWTLRQPGTGLPGSPWGLGYSLLEVPLLAAGTGVDAFTGNPPDGFSRWAVYCYCLGSVLMTGLGMAALFLLLRDLSEWLGMTSDHLRSGWALFVTMAIFFGTNVGYYAFSEMSHASTFLFASLFLLSWWRVRDSDSARGWLLAGLSGGFLSICRWQDVLYLTGPLSYDLLSGHWGKRGAWWRSRAFFAAGVGLCWLPQALEWKAIYGRYLTIPQGGGIFSFPPAHMLQVLLSTQGGWFVWTPITMLGVAGLVFGAFRTGRLYLPWLLVLAMQVAVVGSVPFWSGVESFGARYMLSNTPLIGVGIMTGFALSSSPVRLGMAFASALFCAFTSLFAGQYRLNLVPPVTTLTFSELITDKLRFNQAVRRKAATEEAKASLERGDPEAAIRVLESVLSLGDDRAVDLWLGKAYRATGDTVRAGEADLRYGKILESRLY